MWKGSSSVKTGLKENQNKIQLMLWLTNQVSFHFSTRSGTLSILLCNSGADAGTERVDPSKQALRGPHIIPTRPLMVSSARTKSLIIGTVQQS